MSIRKFEVEVTRTDNYIVEIDTDKLDPQLIPEFERDITKLKEEDKIKGLAKMIGLWAMDNTNDFYEGIGFIKKDNIKPSTDESEIVQGITIETKYLEDYETDITEI